MNESFESQKTPEHKMYENAINNYPEFVGNLAEAKDLQEIIIALEEYTFVDGGADNEHIFFEVENGDDGIEVTPFLTEEFITLLREFIHDSPTEAEEIDLKIEHTALNQAVKRVLGITNDEKTA